MARESAFLKSFEEKFASSLMDWVKRPVRRFQAAKRLYNIKANAPSQKARKVLGGSILAGSGALYGAHKLTEDPDEQMVARRQ